MKCKICQSDIQKFASAKVLHKHDVSYFFCQKCGFIQTEEPFWLAEAYRNAINIYDTGILARNIELSKKIALIINTFFNKKAQFCDYAGGYGILVRLMRDLGFDFYWHDIYCQNLLARGFEVPGGKRSFELLTCLEVFEHFPNPLQEIEKLFIYSDNILFTTNILHLPPPQINRWWYYGNEFGQHVAFYSLNTLKFLAKKFQCNLYSNGRDLHLFSKKKINPLIFKILPPLWAFIPSFAIKLAMKSKTRADHAMLRSLGEPCG